MRPTSRTPAPRPSTRRRARRRARSSPSVFGANLDAAVVDADVDANGAKCQQEVLRGANRIVDTMWRVARTSVQNGLKGKSRRAGAASDLPAHNAGNLVGEVLAQSMDDLQGQDPKRGRSPRQQGAVALHHRDDAARAALSRRLRRSGTVATLAECVAGVARGHYYQSVAGTLCDRDRVRPDRRRAARRELRRRRRSAGTCSTVSATDPMRGRSAASRRSA